jgi:hypothetical protein
MKDDVRDNILNQNGADLPDVEQGILNQNGANAPTPAALSQKDVPQENILNQNGANNTGGSGGDGGWKGDAPDPKNA